MDGDQTIDAFTAAGTYNGAMGTYMCNDASTDCTVSLDADGMITAMSDGWVFTPDAGATSDVADADYLYYGFWLQRTTNEGGVTYGEVQTFAGAQGWELSTTTGIEAVTGGATYNGDAVGVFVNNVTDDQGAIASSTSGQFSADVVLNATFGGGGVLANNQFTIGGTVSDFVLNGQFGEVENDWSVTLGAADFSGRDATATPPPHCPARPHPATT